MTVISLLPRLSLALSLVAAATVAALDWRDLRRIGARRTSLGFVIVATLICWAGCCAWLVVPFPMSAVVAAVLWAPLGIATLLPSQVIAITGGPRDAWLLAQALHEINVHGQLILAGDEVSDADAAWLRQRSSNLDSWRSPETSELIDIWQSKAADFLSSNDPDAFAERDNLRNERIVDLQDRLFGDFRAHSGRRQ